MVKRRSFLRRGASRSRGLASDPKDAVDESKTLDETQGDLNEATDFARDETAVTTTLAQSQQSFSTQGPPLPPPWAIRIVSVNEACEEIWKCLGAVKPEQAAQWLQFLHHALLRTRLDAYKPAEAFFCLQGAALGFWEITRKSQRQLDQEELSFDDEAMWRVWEEAMWAAAALARVCVGAAWRHQLYHRQSAIQAKQGLDDWSGSHGPSMMVAMHGDSMPHASLDESPIDVVATDLNSSPRSFSPMTSSSVGAPSRMDMWYPPIPEILPANMLRFAASAIDAVIPPFTAVQDVDEQQKWLARRKSIAEAQRELVVALCYISPEEEPFDHENSNRGGNRLEWSILEAHNPVAVMVRFWLESCASEWPPLPTDGKSEPVSIEVLNGLVVDKHDESGSDDEEEEDESRNTSEHGSEHSDYIEPENTKFDIAVGTAADLRPMSDHPMPAGDFDHGSDVLIMDDPRLSDEKSTTDRTNVGKFPKSPIWNGALDSRTVDWWIALRVSRSCLDLVTAGWRPQTAVGVEIVAYLLEIVEKGAMLSHLAWAEESTDREARDERLAASLSAVEAVSVLKHMGSNGLIPYSVHSQTVEVLCRLQFASTMTEISSQELFPLGQATTAHDEAEWLKERETFCNQREACFADTADLLWVLLAHKTSAATSLSALLKFADIKRHYPSTASAVEHEDYESVVESLNEVNACLRKATVAVRALSGALWGKLPDIPKIPSLRIAWKSVLDTLCGVLLFLHEDMSETNHHDVVDTLGAHNDEHRSASLVLLLEIFVAFGRFADAELMLGDGLITSDEWEVLISALDLGITHWLRVPEKEFGVAVNGTSMSSHDDILMQIRGVAMSLLSRICEFIDESSVMEGNASLFMMDEGVRTRLYLLLLRKAAPSVSLQKGNFWALAVVRSWASVGFVPHSCDEWMSTACNIIKEAFATCEGGRFGRFVHSSLVRKEALMWISREDDDCSARIHHDSQISRSPVASSPLVSFRYMREHHVELIKRCILPPLLSIFDTSPSAERDILQTEFVQAESHNANALDGNSGPLTRDLPTDLQPSLSMLSSSLEADDLALRSFALRLAGRLFRCVTVERGQRVVFLEMIQSAALAYGNDTESIKLKGDQTQRDCSSNVQFQDRFYLSLDAIHELERSMIALFEDMPHAHGSVPAVIETLCNVLKTHGRDSVSNVGHEQDVHRVGRRLLAFSALLPLVRLRSSHDGRLLLADRQGAIRHLTPKISSLLGNAQNNHERRDRAMGHRISPFLAVVEDCHSVPVSSQARGSRQSTEKIPFSFHAVLAAILSCLRSSLCFSHTQTLQDHGLMNVDSPEELEAPFRCTCYDALTNLVLSGLCVRSLPEFLSIVASTECSREAFYGRTENLSLCKAVGAIAQGAISRCCSAKIVSTKALQYLQDEKLTHDIGNIEAMIAHLLMFCQSDEQQAVLASCRATAAIIPSFELIFPVDVGRINWYHEICVVSMKRLRIDNESVTRIPADLASDDARATESEPVNNMVNVREALISLLYDALCACPSARSNIPSQTMIQILILCNEICMARSVRMSKTCLSLCVRCASVVLDRMNRVDLDECQLQLQVVKKGSKPSADEVLCTDINMQGIPREARLLSDLVAQRRIQLSQEGRNDECIPSKPSGPTCHEQLSMETDDIKRFSVEALEHGKAAWLCGQSILTCRVGSSTSRYRGWIEAVLRSPTSRRRRMIRLPSTISIANPELPSTLWSSPSVACAADSKSFDLPFHLGDAYTGSSAVLTRALSLIAKFDSDFGGMNSDARASHQGMSESKIHVHPYPDLTYVHGSQGILETQSLFIAGSASASLGLDSDEDAIDVVGRRQQIRPTNVLVDNDDIVPVESRRQGETGSVSQWLHGFLGDDNKVEYVEEKLTEFGFSAKMLRCPMSSPGNGMDDQLDRYLSPMQRLTQGPTVNRAISILDRTTMMNSHKVALLFAGRPSEGDYEERILTITGAPPSFLAFAGGLGRLVMTRHLKYFSGGLDTSGFDADGKFAFISIDGEGSRHCPSKSMVVFHTMALMPDGLNNRKRHVGNDNVHIVYIDKGCPFHEEFHADGIGHRGPSMVSGEFGFVTVFVSMMPQTELVRVSVRSRGGLPASTRLQLEHLVGDDIIATNVAPEYVRQVAIRADLACRAIMEDQLGSASWEERHRQLCGIMRFVM